ncbi:MAG TPA: hypothetical protein PL010_04750 [Flavobacteriales bacterium]|nr:hypothetical protein [Flavobacteriales bacterium]MCC6653882.1 hypothetical protein [Flavobacteriales bacterium]HMW95802.1 hypothetical protein [Flavobacteriales bacterium]HNI03919.1 hypothetical protein [Flavobacteriales bacterium]HNK68940.1 hypothetical protein [Flavobacteriales bacterium]
MTRTSLTCACFAALTSASGQLVSPQVVSGGGGTNATLPGGVLVSWTVGETTMGASYVNGGWVTPGFQQAPPRTTGVLPKVFLEGPFVSGSGTMTDGLRSGGLIPLTSPYVNSAQFPQINGGGGETIAPSVLTATGNNAIVDWVYVQLRNGANSSQVLRTRSALVQRDGDVVDMDGVSQLTFVAPAASYHVAVFHRNHLPVMSANPISLSSVGVPVNFTSPSLLTYGTNAQKTIGTVRALWAGDVNTDGIIKYTGGSNDRDPILVTVGSTAPNNTVTAYSTRDVNLNGQVKYTGGSNDRDPVLVNVGSTTPNNTRVRQLP